MTQQKSAEALATEELDALAKEHGSETFVSSGYAYYDDAKQAMIQMYNYGVSAERERLESIFTPAIREQTKALVTIQNKFADNFIKLGRQEEKANLLKIINKLPKASPQEIELVLFLKEQILGEKG